MIEGGDRPHPKFQQFGERSGNGILPGNPEQTFDLVGTIKALVEQERRQFDANKWRETDQFNAAEWMSHRLDTQTQQAYYAHGGKRKEEAQFYTAIKHAYNVIAYDVFSEEHQHEVAMNIDSYAGRRDVDTITLSPQQVQVLDALAAATNIPHTP